MLKHNNFLIFLIVFFFACSSGKDEPIIGPIGKHAAIATAHPVATAVGHDVLKQGGNAFDVAVAVSFALAVVYPRAGNIGGGGFAVYRLNDGQAGSLDFRESAPALAHRDMYLDDAGNVIKGLSTKGALAVGVPGTVAGMFELHKKFGSQSWESLLLPAIQLAKNGVALTKEEANLLNKYKKEIVAENAFTPAFVNKRKWQAGDTLKQEVLAATLEIIQHQGRDGFYKGNVAELIVKAIEKQGGIITLQDLAQYEVKWRDIIKGEYKGYTILSMPPPSSGGIALLQLLKGIEAYPIKSWGHNSAKTVHVMTELERRVYADRATYLGDPDFEPVPVEKLLDDGYLEERFANLDLKRATSSQAIKEGEARPIESLETTHFSIVDASGNALSMTTTLNANYGSKLVVEGGGFFLNNEMDDFSAKPGTANRYGLVGSEANEIVPGKRMLSSMTPTIVEKDGKLFMVLGTPGGSTIITTVFQTILNVIDFDMSMQEAINARRLHHQWLPNYVITEKGALKAETLAKLFLMGHVVIPTRKIGKVEAILVRNGTLEAGADVTRGDDSGMAF